LPPTGTYNSATAGATVLASSASRSLATYWRGGRPSHMACAGTRA
jgi:hypothetical protein